MDLVLHVEALVARKGCTPAQLALAWVLRRGTDIVPIPGSKRIERLAENARAVDVAHALSDGEMRDIDELFPVRAASGTRYAAAGMNTLNR